MTYPQTFEKGSDTRLVSTIDDAVRAKFDGFTLVEGSVEPTSDPVSGPTYRQLQAQAKDLDIPAVGQYEDLAKAVEEAQFEKDLAIERAEATKLAEQAALDAKGAEVTE